MSDTCQVLGAPQFETVEAPRRDHALISAATAALPVYVTAVEADLRWQRTGRVATVRGQLSVSYR